MRQAQIVAVSLNVCCPKCGCPQPNRDDGSEQWLPDQLREVNGGKAQCSSCDEPFEVNFQNKVSVS